jgi:class 3 adenylate cyclase
MDSNSKDSLKKSFMQQLLKQLEYLWNRIINIGIHQDTDDFDKKRTRLINGICSWAFVIYFVYIISYANDQQLRFVFYESVAGVIGYALPIIFNHYRRYNVACHFFCIFNLLFYLEQSLGGGSVIGVEYIFVPSCVTAMLFFKKPLIVFFYFISNFLFFGLAKLSFSLLKPVFVYHNEAHSIYVANHVTMFVILFLIVYYFKSENARQEKLLETRNVSLGLEKQKSDNLLHNILPHETAEELKHTGTAKPRRFNMVTVLFTDFKGFTSASENMDPEKLVHEIDFYFSKFDEITSKHRVEKIKTIGDAYLCAGGIPEESSTHAHDVVMAALEIQEFMLQNKKEKESKGESFFELRLGIHSGPVVAGIVGTKKFAYDIWGDTVNVASRMESSGEAGKVNISQTTYQLIQDHFTCLSRGKIAAKNKGEVDMYFVEGVKNAAVSQQGIL